MFCAWRKFLAEAVFLEGGGRGGGRGGGGAFDLPPIAYNVNYQQSMGLYLAASPGLPELYFRFLASQ
jgi:hypothetical protein